MDPITIVLFVMAVLWLIRRGVEDVTAMITGREAPRLTRMRERRAVTRLTVTEAVSVRVARLIAQGRDPNRQKGPLRLYVGELWADAWQDAHDHHERVRRAKTRPATSSTAAPDLDDTEIVDAEIVDNDDTWDDPWEWATEPDPPQTPTNPPAPGPVQDTTWKEPPMPRSSIVTVSSEVTSPRDALAWADANRDTNDQVTAQLDFLVNYLKGAGLGPAALATVGAVLTAADTFASAVRGAQGKYAEHLLIHQDLASDPALRDTLIGYLDAAKV